MILCFFSAFCSSLDCKILVEKVGRVENLPFYYRHFSKYVVSQHPRKIYVVSAENPHAPQPTHVILLSGASIPVAYLEMAKRAVVLSWPFPHLDWFSCPPQLGVPIPKQHIISMSLENCRRSSPGFLLGHRLAKYILNTDLPVAIYGGIRTYVKADNRLKSVVEGVEAFRDYRFHIVLEENYTDLVDHPSGALISALLYQATPIYLGGVNGLDGFFLDQGISVREMCSENADENELFRKMCEVVWKICKNPEWYVKSIDQQGVFSRVNLLENSFLYGVGGT